MNKDQKAKLRRILNEEMDYTINHNLSKFKGSYCDSFDSLRGYVNTHQVDSIKTLELVLEIKFPNGSFIQGESDPYPIPDTWCKMRQPPIGNNPEILVYIPRFSDIENSAFVGVWITPSEDSGKCVYMRFSEDHLRSFVRPCE